MKSTHLRKRIVAALLAVVLAVSLAAPSLAIEETGVSKSGSNGLTWEEIDSSSVQVESPIQANTGVVEKTVEHEDTDMVRVSIILKDASTLEKGFTSDEIAAADRSAMQYRRKLEKQQDSMAAAISKQALNGATLTGCCLEYDIGSQYHFCKCPIWADRENQGSCRCAGGHS